MDVLPVELLRLIYESCDLPGVKALRLVSSVFAVIGLEYLMRPALTMVGWRDDVSRLHSIATHKRLKTAIRSLSINFADVDEYHARHFSLVQHDLEDPEVPGDPEDHQERLREACLAYWEAKQRGMTVPPFDSRPQMVLEAFRNLPNLRHLEVTFTRCPFDIHVLAHVFQGLPSCRKMDRDHAAKNLALIACAVKETNLSSLAIDRFPLEILRLPHERKHWFDCVSASWAKLSTLNITLDPSFLKLPKQKLKAIKGLGQMLRCATNVTHLTLAFHTYGMPKFKFIISFDSLLEGFRFERLTDLKLEGISCDEEDLRNFILRHAATLERLRLGGRGLAKVQEGPLGGIHLFHGTFRGLFVGLRNRLPKLERIHLEGDFECTSVERFSGEAYSFHGVTNDDWEDMPAIRRAGRPASAAGMDTRDCLDFERYLLQGGRYPGSPSVAPAAAVSAQ